jgi:hypothetical protein
LVGDKYNVTKRSEEKYFAPFCYVVFISLLKVLVLLMRLEVLMKLEVLTKAAVLMQGVAVLTQVGVLVHLLTRMWVQLLGLMRMLGLSCPMLEKREPGNWEQEQSYGRLS